MTDRERLEALREYERKLLHRCFGDPLDKKSRIAMWSLSDNNGKIDEILVRIEQDRNPLIRAATMDEEYDLYEEET